MAFNIVERFWRKVNQLPGADACWEWTGGFGSHGYGYFYWDDKDGTAHRFAYTHAVGPITGNLCVLHRCDNRKCVRPSHLFLGTRAENQADMAQKLRSGVAKRTPDEVRQIRAQYAAGAIQADLAAQYGVSQTGISWILRHGWKHVPHRVELPRGVCHRRRRAAQP